MESDTKGPREEEMSLPTSTRLRELDTWLGQKLADKDVKTRLGHNVDILIGVSRRSVKHITRDVGCTESHLSRIRNAKATPSFILLSTLATVLKTNVRVLLEADLDDEFKNLLDQINRK